MPCNCTYDPVLWGTITDWLIVGLTLFASVFLYRNFTEQLKINKASLQKHRRDIMPIFRIALEEEEFFLYLDNAPAFKILIFPTDSFFKRKGDEPTEGWHDFWDIEKYAVKIPYEDYKALAQIEEFDRQFSIWEIIFFDQEGRQYEQKINGDRDVSFIDFPKLIKDID